MSMSFFYLTPFKLHKPAQKTKMLCHTPIATYKPCPTNTKIGVTIIQGPQNPIIFGKKVQTHTSPRPRNCRNCNKHHPVNKSPTPKKLAYTAPGSKTHKPPMPQDVKKGRYNSTCTITRIHVTAPHQGTTNS